MPKPYRYDETQEIIQLTEVDKNNIHQLHREIMSENSKMFWRAIREKLNGIIAQIIIAAIAALGALTGTDVLNIQP